MMQRALFADPVTRRLEEMGPEEVERQARLLECFETPAELTRAILQVELLTRHVWDPCCGTGGMARVLSAAGHQVVATDIFDWGYGEGGRDFLLEEQLLGATIVMNPPFSRAVDFVRHAHALGARKVVMIQRRAFWEGEGRAAGVWRQFPPNRIYTPDLRPSFWRFDISREDRKDKNGGQTCHDVFVWERGHPAGTLSGHLIMGAT